MAIKKSEVFTVKVIVVTEQSEEEHQRRVNWALENISKSNQYLEGVHTSSVIFSEDGKVIMSSSKGTLRLSQDQHQEISDQLLDDYEEEGDR